MYKKNIVLHNCTIIDGTGKQPIEDGIIIIEDGMIKAVGKSEGISATKGYKKIDLKGRYVLPGIINAHVHDSYCRRNVRRWLKAGITCVRDLGPHIKGDFIEARNILNSDLRNSRIVAATPLITTKKGYGGYTVCSPQHARDKVLDFINRGVDIIKVSIEDKLEGKEWPVISAEEVKAIVDAAHSKGIRVSAHVTHARNIRIAADAGVDDIAHMVVEELEDDVILEVIKKNIYWIPTLELWNGVSKMHRLNWCAVAMQNLGKFYKLGGKIAFGNDFGGYRCKFDKGFPVNEFRLMKGAGMSNSDIILSATKNAAYVCNMEDICGTVEKEKVADLIVVCKNPLENPEVLKKPGMVIKSGIIINRRFGEYIGWL